MYKRLMGLITLMFVGFGATPASAQVFDGFTALTFPQSEVPIGARWLPGVGVDGPPTSPSNVTISRGLSSAALSQELKASITGSLANYLGLGGSILRAQSANYADLTLYRVTDLSANGNVGAGQQMLNQAIKAGQVTIRTSTSGAAQIQASAQARGLPVSVQSDGSGGSIVNLDGSNLFVAYQVVEFRRRGVREQEKRFGGRDDVNFDGGWRVRVCCVGPEHATLEVQNLGAVSSDGEYAPQRFEYDYDRNRDTEYTLRPIREGQTIVSNLLRVRLDPVVVCATQTPDGRPACFPPAWNHSRHTMRLTTTRTHIVPVRRPRGIL